MSRRANRRINLRLWRAFLLQLAIISATAVMGVYLAEFAIREILIVSALQKEADYFWARRNIEGDTAAPNTHTLIGYLFNVAEPKTICFSSRLLTSTGLPSTSSSIGAH